MLPLLADVEAAADAGKWAAGFITYEASPAFDSAFRTHTPNGPLAWFVIFDAPVPHTQYWPAGDCEIDTWKPQVDTQIYLQRIRDIKQLIAAGDSYQVNYCYPMRSRLRGDPLALFERLIEAQPTDYSAFIDTGDSVICSASPELFFRREGRNLLCRPMKGTRPRRATVTADDQARRSLRRSEKDQAENLMIVDMLRNDLGRIAEPGSVRVPVLFRIEQYPTVYQMTSDVTARSDASLPEIFRALFPCASITGAPKVRSMEIIRDLETVPRGVYTGCIGYVGPHGEAEFSVAIRCVQVDRQSGAVRYGVGGGIVWDSVPEIERRECDVKCRVLRHTTPEFELLETMRWDPGLGIDLWPRHLERIQKSAKYYGFRLDKALLTQCVESIQSKVPLRVRLRLSAAGNISVDEQVLDLKPAEPWQVPLDTRPVNPRNPFLYHKTTNRRIYDAARARFPDAPDVILWNADGEITETSIGNVIVFIEGKWVTPPIHCGLLPGVKRAELLARGEIRERVITRQELERAERVQMINAVRGRVPLEVVFRVSRPGPC